MTEEQAVYEVTPKKMGRPKKTIKGEKMWIPAECVEFVKRYIEVSKQKGKKNT